MKMPFICALLMWGAINLSVAQDQPPATTNNVAQDPQVVSILKEMATLHSQINSVQSSQAKAEVWLNLNRKADALATRMTELLPKVPDSGPPTPTPELNQIADQSKALGISVNYCEIGTDWAADSTGYENYLNLWPDGPNTDEAFWKSKVESNGCGDCEGTIEEYQHGVEMYSAFIKRYPSSSLIERAKSQLNAYEAGLREEQKREAKPAPGNSPN
jgi:hypothetical protein